MREKAMYDTPLAREALQHLNAISDAQQRRGSKRAKATVTARGP